MKRNKPARLECFKLELYPSYHEGVMELRWEIRSNRDPHIVSQVEQVVDDHFKSMIDYVTEASYRKLRDYLGLKSDNLRQRS